MSATIPVDSQGRPLATRCGAPVTIETRRITRRDCMIRTKDASGRCWRHR